MRTWPEKSRLCAFDQEREIFSRGRGIRMTCPALSGKMLPFANEFLETVNVTGRGADAFQPNLEILQRGRDRETKIMLSF